MSRDLVSVSRRGLVGKADPGDGGALQLSDDSAGVVGVFVTETGARELVGGADGLSGRLEPLSAPAGGASK